ncbi:unnamed protein product, partial [Ectocarpus fasciculatus]
CPERRDLRRPGSGTGTRLAAPLQRQLVFRHMGDWFRPCEGRRRGRLWARTETICPERRDLQRPGSGTGTRLAAPLQRQLVFRHMGDWFRPCEGRRRGRLWARCHGAGAGASDGE